MRKCGTCSACCTHFPVPDLDKPAGQPCQHLKTVGCGIHETRPEVCRAYHCAWVRGLGSKRDRPDKSGVIADRRNTQFGQEILVARSTRPNAVMTPRGRKAIENLGTCLVVADHDPDLVIGAFGSPEFIAEVQSKGPMPRLGGSREFIRNVVQLAMAGKIHPGLTDGR